MTPLREGPPLQALMHRLSECPDDFFADDIDRTAVVSDLSLALGGGLLKDDVFRKAPTVVLIAAWLLYDPWFREQKRFAADALRFLEHALHKVAALVDAKAFVTDPDRREELVRLTLHALALRPEGESEAQAADRLTTLSSVERAKVIQETRAAQERVRQVREAMRKKAAEEAAAAYGRE